VANLEAGLAGATGAIAFTDGALTLGSIAAPSLTLTDAATVTQAPGTALSLTTLDIEGAGRFTLTNAGNAVADFEAGLGGTTGPIALADGNVVLGSIAASSLTLTDGAAVTQASGTILKLTSLDLEGPGSFTLTNLNAVANLEAGLGGATGPIGFTDGAVILGSIAAPSLTLTDAAAVTQSAGTTLTLTNLDLEGPGRFTLANAGNAVANFEAGLAGATGPIALADGSVVLGAVSATSLTLTDGGTVTQASGKSLDLTTLDLEGPGSFALTNPNAVANLEAGLAGATGAIAFTDGALTLGSIAAPSLTLTDAATVTQASGTALVLTSLDLEGAGRFTLANAGNAVADFEAGLGGTTGPIALADGSVVLGSIAASSLTLTDRAAVTQAPGTALTLTSLDLEGTGSFTLTNAGNAVADFEAGLGGTTGPIALADGSVVLGAVSATSLVLTDSGAVTQATGKVLTLTSLDLEGPGSFALTNLNAVANLEAGLGGATGEIGFTDGALTLGSIAAPSLTLTDAATVTQAPGTALSLTTLDIEGTGSFTLANAGNAVADFEAGLAGATGSISLADSVPLTIAASGVDVGSAATLTLTDASGVTQAGAIVAGTLDLEGGGPFTLTDTDNAVARLNIGLGGATGAISFTDGSAVTIAGAAQSAKFTAASIDFGRFRSSGTLTATGLRGITVEASVVAQDALTMLARDAGASIRIDTGASLVSLAGDVALGEFGPGGSIVIAGRVASPQILSINSAGSVIASGTITGFDDLIDAGGAVTLRAGGRLVAARDLWIGYGASLSAFAGRGVDAVSGPIDIAGAAVAGVDAGLRTTAGDIAVGGSLTAGDWVFLDAAGNIGNAGSISATGASLTAGGNIDEVETGSLVASTLEGSSGGYTRLDGAGNQIATLAEFTTGGSLASGTGSTGFALADGEALTLAPHLAVAAASPVSGGVSVSVANVSTGIVDASLGNIAISMTAPHLALTFQNHAELEANRAEVLLSAGQFVQAGMVVFDTQMALIDTAGNAYAGPGALTLPQYRPAEDLGAYVNLITPLLAHGTATKGQITLADLTDTGVLILNGNQAKMSGQLNAGGLAVIGAGGTALFTGQIHGAAGLGAAANQEFARQCARFSIACGELTSDFKFNDCAIGSPSCIPLPPVVLARPVQVEDLDIYPQSNKTDDVDVEPVNSGREDAY
jgi:hypothetical protein